MPVQRSLHWHVFILKFAAPHQLVEELPNWTKNKKEFPVVSDPYLALCARVRQGLKAIPR
jgi:hypothetical protein